MDKLRCKVLILGLGNLLMCDDGLGIRAAEMLKQKSWPEKVLILEVGTSVLNYLDEISRAHHVIAIDAVQSGRTPGSVYRFDEKNIAHPPVNQRDAHGFSIFQVVDLAREMTGLPKVLTIYGVEPLELGFGDRLSHELEKVLPRLVNLITSEIKEVINIDL